MSRHIVRSLLLACCAVLIAACSSLGPKLESPKVDIVNVQMLSTDMFAQKFKVRLKLQNPNQLELKVRGLEYEIGLMGDPFAEGNSDDHFVVPALGEAEFDMTVTTDFVSGLGRLISRMGGGRLENVDYEIRGTVFVDKGFIHKIPFDRKGKVNFTKAQAKKAGE
jgi:LEA14-like dessication related protein